METKKKGTIKYLIRIVAFLLILSFLTFELSYAFRPVIEDWDQEMTGFMGYWGEPKDSIDVLCYGGSELFTYWAPLEAYEHYGFTSYSLGRSALRTPLYASLLEEALETQKPQLVVIGFRAFATDLEVVPDGYFRWTADMLPYDTHRVDMINASMPYMVDADENPITDSSSYYFDIIKYHAEWKNESLNSLSKLYKNWRVQTRRDKILSSTKGYYYSTDVAAQELTDYSDDTKTLSISAMAEESLKDLLAVLKKHNVKALFLMTPFKVEDFRKERSNYLKAIVEKEGFDYLDCNDYFDEIGIDGATDFYNTAHTNISGALKTTRFVGQYIMGHYDIKTSTDWSSFMPDWADFKRKGLEEVKIKAEN